MARDGWVDAEGDDVARSGASEAADLTSGARTRTPRSTSSFSAHLLLVERDRSAVPLIDEMIRAAWPGPITFTHAERIDDISQHLLSGPVTAVLLGADEDIAALDHVRSLAPGVPVLVLTHSYSYQSAVLALRAGAQEYVSRTELTAEDLRRRLLHAIERKRAELQLANRALQDPLTGLPNRTLFMDRLSVALDRLRRSGSMIAVLFLDVDNFKLINDSLGHTVGDQVLTALAARLRSVLRPMDTVARFGGDEFIFLFEGLSGTAEAVTIAERVREVANLPVNLGDRTELLSVSIGVATANHPGASPEALIHRADEAMYYAKAQASSDSATVERPVPGPAEDPQPPKPGPADDSQPPNPRTAEHPLPPNPEPAEDLQRPNPRTADDSQPSDPVPANAPDDTAERLRQAVEREELRVVYQPVFKFDGEREVTGFEALVRWEHPERGLIEPSQFLPLAEQLGVIPDIDRFVLKETLTLLGRLLPARAEMTASVNLAHARLSEDELAGAVTALKAAGVGPDRLYVEIPERLLSDHPDEAFRAAEVLRAAGVRVILDDYGTGSVPLGDLRRLKADVLKIDQSIVGELRPDLDGGMVGAVVDLGHALGMQVVAEGVETDEQLLELKTLGCDAAQGYLLCRPMRADQLEELIMHAA